MIIFTRELKNTEKIKQFCADQGIILSGIADLQPFKKEKCTIPPGLLSGYTHAISIALRLDDTIIDEIQHAPTPAYNQHYLDINRQLDAIAKNLVEFLHQEGFKATRVPASRIIDEDNQRGSISHKAIARMAGLGWQGKSLLIINPTHGPRIRLASILTDMLLSPDGAIENMCGDCSKCADACPAGAIKNVSTTDRYPNREMAVDISKCHDKLQEFKNLPGIPNGVCGVCIVVCPHGRKHQ